MANKGNLACAAKLAVFFAKNQGARVRAERLGGAEIISVAMRLFGAAVDAQRNGNPAKILLFGANVHLVFSGCCPKRTRN